MKTKYWLVCLTMALASFSTHALERIFPPIAKRGTLSMKNYPDSIAINGKARKLSAGAWIRNENNTIDLPSSLMGQDFVVNYTEDTEGAIDRVWILSTDEAKKPAPNGKSDDQRMYLID